MKNETVISKERAVELVDSYLARDRLTWPWRGAVPELAVCHVEEYAVGWLAFWNSAKYARTRDASDSLMGGGGHCLVDRHDGSIHYVPAAWWLDEGWEEQYLLQTKGVRPPDALAAAVRELANSAGLVAAMGHLRKQAPRLSLQQAKAYVATVRDGAEPPEELASLTRKEGDSAALPVETLAGPVR
ncbi:YrhB domain-containing protein [Streptomyces nojiriensis]|uniref:YrhB domain-containing protein n=1 Tax=Streptomyces nojiriensis TaxID=66374 RepID=UPI0036CDE0EC